MAGRERERNGMNALSVLYLGLAWYCCSTCNALCSFSWYGINFCAWLPFHARKTTVHPLRIERTTDRLGSAMARGERTGRRRRRRSNEGLGGYWQVLQPLTHVHIFELQHKVKSITLLKERRKRVSIIIALLGKLFTDFSYHWLLSISLYIYLSLALAIIKLGVCTSMLYPVSSF